MKPPLSVPGSFSNQWLSVLAFSALVLSLLSLMGCDGGGEDDEASLSIKDLNLQVKQIAMSDDPLGGIRVLVSAAYSGERTLDQVSVHIYFFNAEQTLIAEDLVTHEGLLSKGDVVDLNFDRLHDLSSLDAYDCFSYEAVIFSGNDHARGSLPGSC